MKKIPIKIEELTSPSGQKSKDIVIDVHDYFEMPGNVEEKIKNFKKKYFDTLKKAKKFIPEKGKRRKTSDFWKLSRLLEKLKKSVDNEFVITNYHEALQRDFVFTGRYIDKILEFGQYYKKDEVLDSISISYYVELTQKIRKLDRMGLFEQEKNRLLKMGKKGNLPGVMEYRLQLQKILQNESYS